MAVSKMLGHLWHARGQPGWRLAGKTARRPVMLECLGDDDKSNAHACFSRSARRAESAEGSGERNRLAEHHLRPTPEWLRLAQVAARPAPDR